MDVFASLALVLGLAAVAGLIAKMLRQPALLGYLLAGIVMTSLGWATGGYHEELVTILGQLGITLLLFLVGLELPISQLKQLGKTSLITGFGQIAIATAVRYPVLKLLGISSAGSWYLAVALSFSSTIIIVKLLTEKKDLQSLHGKLAVGFLLVQDFVAIGILTALAGLGGGDLNWLGIASIALKGSLLVGVALILSGKVLPRILAWVGESSEMLFVAAIAWCVVVAAFVASPWVGLSVEIGGFLAGLALSGAVEHLQIGARIRPLRDFFLTLFFVSLGATIHLTDIVSVWPAVTLLSIFVLLGNPLVVLVILSVMGYRKRTSFLTAINMGQISEFSLIVVAAAARVGHVGSTVVATTAMVGAITMVLSTYMIVNADKIYYWLQPVLSLFEFRRKKAQETIEKEQLSNHVILVGHNRIGSVLFPALKKLGVKVIVVDFNPHTIEKLTNDGVDAIYGDLGDFDLYDDLGLDRATLIVSTVPDISDNRQFLQHLPTGQKRPVTVVTALDVPSSDILYREGADYVLIPHAVGGEYLAHVLNRHGVEGKMPLRKYLRSIKHAS